MCAAVIHISRYTDIHFNMLIDFKCVLYIYMFLYSLIKTLYNYYI